MLLFWLSVLALLSVFWMLIFTQVWRHCHKAWPLASVTSPSRVNPKKFLPTANERRGLGSLAAAGKSLEDLKEANRQLQAKLSSIDWPPLTSFTLNEEVYSLPLTSTSEGAKTALIQPTQQELEYLAGFFDGDGCVRGGPSLTVGQSVDGVAVLMRMHKAFGGSIRRWRDGKGLRKPILAWSLHGSDARRVANLLAPHSVVKRRQLEVVAAGLSVHANGPDRSLALGVLKCADSAVVRPCSWAYLAGFFDAEGHIEHPKAGLSLALVITQKYATVLECLHDFLATETGTSAKLSRVSTREAYVLKVYGYSICKALLQKMLDAGLTRKSAQAKLALGLTKLNAKQVHDAMSGMVGNQGFERRLDSDGITRARVIELARARANRVLKTGRTSLAKSVLADVERQKREHAFLNAQRIHDKLQAYIDELHAMNRKFRTQAVTSH